MSAAQAVSGIRRAAARRVKADADRKAATAQLRDYAQAARDARVSITQIAREAGLSRQGVYDLLAERP